MFLSFQKSAMSDADHVNDSFLITTKNIKKEKKELSNSVQKLSLDIPLKNVKRVA